MRKIIPELDGVRALAILAVMALHAVSGHPSGNPIVGAIAGIGWCGVDLFFVLSGFLITGTLIDTKGTPRALMNFYLRRVLRIFPLYYTALILYFFVIPAAASLFGRLQHFQPHEQIWYWSYLCNWSPSLGMAHDQLAHFWSLSIEEQFYVVWPLLILTLSGRNSRLLCGALIVSAPCLRLALLLSTSNSGPLLYRNTLCRVDALAVGALCAFLVRDPRSIRLAMDLRSRLLLISGLTLAACIGIGGTSSYLAPMNVIGLTAVAVICGYFILWAREGGLGLQVWLRRPALRSIGKYSYGMYVFHVPIGILLRRGFEPVMAGFRHPLAYSGFLTVEIASTAVLAWAAAYVSWHLLENPFLKLKSYFEPVREVRKAVYLAPSYQGVGFLREQSE